MFHHGLFYISAIDTVGYHNLDGLNNLPFIAPGDIILLSLVYQLTLLLTYLGVLLILGNIDS